MSESDTDEGKFPRDRLCGILSGWVNECLPGTAWGVCESVLCGLSKGFLGEALNPGGRVGEGR